MLPAFIFIWYKILIPWQHRDYRMLTALSLGLRPRESGQLSMIIPHNHGITITYMYVYLCDQSKNVRYSVHTCQYIYTRLYIFLLSLTNGLRSRIHVEE